MASVISMDDLSPTQREVAEVIGLESFLSLTKRYGGETLYVPKFEELIKDPRNREIREKYNGYNSTELAREYHLSERYIRYLTSDIREKKRARPLSEQVSFDGF